MKGEIMIYMIMCGGEYPSWDKPKQLTEIKGEPIVARTIRLLRECGVENIAISSNNPNFEQFGVPVVKNDKNDYVERAYNDVDGFWCDCFYPTDEPTCYIMGDVVFSREAIKKIVETQTDSYEFFASAPPFDSRYIKDSAEPYAFKVKKYESWKSYVDLCKMLDYYGYFKRKPLAWEFWQVVKGTPLNIIDYTNYTVINDWTCDVDKPEDIEKIEKVME